MSFAARRVALPRNGYAFAYEMDGTDGYLEHMSIVKLKAILAGFMTVILCSISVNN